MISCSVSIVIPVYNVRDYIVRCLNSVVSQSYKEDLECLLIDDCGNDDSIAIAEKYISEYEGNIHFRIIHHNRNRGLSAARNTGTSASLGDYIYFLDSDDYISPDCIEILSAPLKQKAYDFVCGNFKINGEGQSDNPITIPSCELNNEDILYGYTHGVWPLTAWNKLVRKSFLEENNIQFKEGLIHEDNLWSFHLARLASSIYLQHKETYIYNIHPGSIMTSSNSVAKHLDAYIVILSEMASHKNENILIRNYLIPFSDGILNTCFNNNIDIKYYYNKIKETINPTPFFDYLHYHHRIKTLLRYIHYALPTPVGISLCKVFFCLTH